MSCCVATGQKILTGAFYYVLVWQRVRSTTSRQLPTNVCIAWPQGPTVLDRALDGRDWDVLPRERAPQSIRSSAGTACPTPSYAVLRRPTPWGMSLRQRLPPRCCLCVQPICGGILFHSQDNYETMTREQRRAIPAPTATDVAKLKHLPVYIVRHAS